MKSIYWITNKTENKAIIIIIIIINLSTPCFVLPSPSLWSTVPFKFSAKIFCAPSGFPPDETLWSRVRTWTASRRCAPFRAFLGDCTAWIAFRSAGTWTGDRRCGSSCAISAMACPQIPSGRNRTWILSASCGWADGCWGSARSSIFCRTPGKGNSDQRAWLSRGSWGNSSAWSPCRIHRTWRAYRCCAASCATSEYKVSKRPYRRLGTCFLAFFSYPSQLWLPSESLPGSVRLPRRRTTRSADPARSKTRSAAVFLPANWTNIRTCRRWIGLHQFRSRCPSKEPLHEKFKFCRSAYREMLTRRALAVKWTSRVNSSTK